MTAPRPGKGSIGVRVRPNANDFIRDLERQLKDKKKTFYVDVHANLKPANKEIQEWTRTTLKSMGAKIPVRADMSPANKDVAAWRTKQRGIKTNIPIGADLTKALSEVLAFRKVVGKPIDIELKVSTASANRAAERFAAALSRKSINVPINLDPNSVRKTANKIDTDLIRRLQNQGGVLIGVDADTSQAEARMNFFEAREEADPIHKQVDLDLKRARLEMLQLKAELARRKLEVQVDVKTSGVQRLQRSFDMIEKRLGNFSFIRSLDVGPFNLGKPTGLMGTLTTLNLLAGALPTATYGVTALSKALVDLGGAAALLPGMLGGFLASLSTFSVGISGVSDAFEKLTDMWTETPAEAASAARRSVQAHNQLRQAVREEAQAQRDVAAARREATNDLRNLNNELRGSVLNEAQAILDLQKARDRLAQGGFENATDMMQAQLDEAKAYQNLIDVRERNTQLQQKANDESAKGVENSDKVQEALERQTRASEQAAMALEAISSTQATSALGKFQQELDQLTPSAREFVLSIAGMRGEFEMLRNMVQETIFQGTGPAFQQMISNLLPIVGPGMQRIAAAMNDNILTVFKELESPTGKSIIERILGGTAEAQKMLSGLINPLLRGFGTLMAAGAEHLPQLVDLFTRLAERFANFVETADRNGNLDKFLDRGIGALEKMAELGINLIQIISSLGDTFDGDLLQSLVDATQKFEDWINSAEGQEKINELIQDARDLWQQWKPILEDLPGIMGRVADAAQIVLKPLLSILDRLTSFMVEHPGLVEGFVAAWLGAKVLVGAASPIVQLAKILTGVVSAVKALPTLLAKIPGSLPGLLMGNSAAGGKFPGIIPALGPAATIGLPAILGNEIAGQVTGQDLPLPTAIGQGFGAPKRIFDDIFGGGSEWTRISRANEAIKDVKFGGQSVPKYEPLGHDASQALIGSLVERGSKAGQWIAEAGVGLEQARRYSWLFSQPNAEEIINDPNFNPPKDYPSFDKGGFTNWGVEQGKQVVLHGKEYVQPHQTVDYYGVEAMEAIHQRRVPKQVLDSFYVGGFNFPLHPQVPGPAPAPAPTPAPAPAPTPAATPAPVQHGTGTGLPSLTTGVGTGPLPGPANPPQVDTTFTPTTPGPVGGQDDQQSINILGFNVPIGGAEQQMPDWSDPGLWPFGIPGIGRPGHTEADAGKWLADWGAKTLLGFGETLLGGVLGFFGAEGLLNNPYMNSIRGAIGYYSSLPGSVSSQKQADGADATNANVASLLDQYYNMPLNPLEGAPQLLALGNAAPNAPGNEGLQVNTARGKQIIQSVFPWATNIGGVREDALKWHPSGLALDVMIPGAGGLNDPTPAEGKALGDQMYAWLQANKEALGIDYIMWQEKDHYNHLHVNFKESGFADALGLGTGSGQSSGGGSAQSEGLTALSELNAALGLDSATPPQGNGPLNLDSGSPVGRSLPSGYKRRAVRGGPKAVGDHEAEGLLQTPTEKGLLKAAAKQLYMRAGMPPAEWPAFDRLIEKESSWNPTAKNPKSTAYGLGQFLDITDAKYGPRSADPMVQLPRIFQYIRDRYDGSPAKALDFHNKNNWYDRGGWLMPGQSTVDNATGKPELVIPWDDIPSFYQGGMLPRGAVTGGRRPLPRGPEIGRLKPQPSAPVPIGPKAPPPSQLPGNLRPAPGGPADPNTPLLPGQSPAPPDGNYGPAPDTGGASARGGGVAAAQLGTGPGVAAGGSHLHPAAQKGIRSGAAALGSVVSSAISAAAAAGSFGAAGAAGAAGGGMGSLIGGLFTQGGKIVEDVANVGASFLVGNITNGTTPNPYGVTQRATNPTGGTRIVDNSQRYGDVYTQSPREFFRQLDLREAQHSQGSLGGYDRYA
ncbi:tape measure protein [Mycobacterium phage RedRaider77]|uniref:Tape measure protein n=1 Tax=Mycobacterium phage RedRaider77 TaxID=2500794 RepID=A0A411AYB3_9CAUD|nr:tape measure protein [Mycobacterium phage RedRaider77]